MGTYAVIRTPAFDLLAADYAREHPKLEADLEWLFGRLAEGPDLMGDHVPELSGLALPIFKTLPMTAWAKGSPPGPGWGRLSCGL